MFEFKLFGLIFRYRLVRWTASTTTNFGLCGTKTPRSFFSNSHLRPKVVVEEAHLAGHPKRVGLHRRHPLVVVECLRPRLPWCCLPVRRCPRRQWEWVVLLGWCPLRRRLNSILYPHLRQKCNRTRTLTQYSITFHNISMYLKK